MQQQHLNQYIKFIFTLRFYCEHQKFNLTSGFYIFLFMVADRGIIFICSTVNINVHIHSILQWNKFNTINIFDFDIVWCSIIKANVVLHQKYGSLTCNFYPLFASWQLQEQNKTRTSEPEIYWKIRTVSLSQTYLVFT